MENLVANASDGFEINKQIRQSESLSKLVRTNRNFSNEERAELCRSPYVASVVRNQVKFTLEFKKIAYEELLKGEKTMREIFQKYGISPKILGTSRISYYSEEIRKLIKIGKNFDEIHNRPRSKIKRVIVTTPQKRFTAEEKAELLRNPYVATIIDDYVYFTSEFKEIAYNEFRKGEKLVREFFQEHGLSPEILGKTRIMNFASTIRKWIKRSINFKEENLNVLPSKSLRTRCCRW